MGASGEEEVVETKGCFGDFHCQMPAYEEVEEEVNLWTEIWIRGSLNVFFVRAPPVSQIFCSCSV